MMRANSLNLQVYPVRTEMTAPSLDVCSIDEDEPKDIIVHKTLSQIFSTDEDKPKRITVNKTLSQNCSMDEHELCSKEEGK